MSKQVAYSMVLICAIMVSVIGYFFSQPSKIVGEEASSGEVATSPTTASVDVSKIFGKIQIVDSFPDYKVQVVDSFPDLRVQVVNSFPDKAGKWQMVQSFPDFKVQIVDSFPDFKIQSVSSFPGKE